MTFLLYSCEEGHSGCKSVRHKTTILQCIRPLAAKEVCNWVIEFSERKEQVHNTEEKQFTEKGVYIIFVLKKSKKDTAGATCAMVQR